MQETISVPVAVSINAAEAIVEADPAELDGWECLRSDVRRMRGTYSALGCKDARDALDWVLAEMELIDRVKE